MRCLIYFDGFVGSWRECLNCKGFLGKKYRGNKFIEILKRLSKSNFNFLNVQSLSSEFFFLFLFYLAASDCAWRRRGRLVRASNPNKKLLKTHVLILRRRKRRQALCSRSIRPPLTRLATTRTNTTPQTKQGCGRE